MLEVFIIGLLIVNSLLLLWFFSTFKNTLGKILFKRDLTPVQFDDIVFLKSKLLGGLTGCWICCSFWLSFIIGIAMLIGFNMPIYWPIMTFLSYPCFCYLFYKAIK